MSGWRFNFTEGQECHAPRAARQAFEQLLCADAGGADHICEMYDGHDRDIERPYRLRHHCECGHGWESALIPSGSPSPVPASPNPPTTRTSVHSPHSGQEPTPQHDDKADR